MFSKYYYYFYFMEVELKEEVCHDSYPNSMVIICAR